VSDAKKLVAEAHAVCEYSELPGHDKAVELGDNPGGCEHGLMHEKVTALGNALEAAEHDYEECYATYLNLHEMFTDEGAQGYERGAGEERTRIVKRLREAADCHHKAYTDEDNFVADRIRALADEIEGRDES